jgi:uncharacterized protein (TIGR02646 family)
MRVHGNISIIRRITVEQKNDYHEYLNELRDDFNKICGYCGKREAVTTKGFEIDHFVPKSIDPDRELDYTNLVYSCFTCNRKKSKKWPSMDKAIPHTGTVGFIDPACNDFDLHLHRMEDGCIKGITELGQYICNKGFRFNTRPMSEVWLCSEIIARQEVLDEQIDLMSDDDKKSFIKLSLQLSELRKLLFEKKE